MKRNQVNIIELLPGCPFIGQLKSEFSSLPNLLGTAARIEGKGMRTIPPFFAGCGNY